jgi:hypothetical protein
MANRLPLNENAFSQPLNDDGHYYVGSMATDGCVSIDYKGGKCVNFTSKDYEYVAGFKKFLSSGHKICTRKDGLFAFSVYNDQLFNDLYNFGVTPRKSLDLELVGDVVHNPHTWRGAIDGDGSISWSGFTPVGLATSSIAFAVQFRCFCTEIGVKSTIYDVPSQLNLAYCVKVTSYHCKLLLETVYSAGATAVRRKSISAREVIEFIKRKEQRGKYSSFIYQEESSKIMALVKEQVASEFSCNELIDASITKPLVII